MWLYGKGPRRRIWPPYYDILSNINLFILIQGLITLPLLWTYISMLPTGIPVPITEPTLHLFHSSGYTQVLQLAMLVMHWAGL